MDLDVLNEHEIDHQNDVEQDDKYLDMVLVYIQDMEWYLQDLDLDGCLGELEWDMGWAFLGLAMVAFGSDNNWHGQLEQ